MAINILKKEAAPFKNILVHSCNFELLKYVAVLY